MNHCGRFVVAGLCLLALAGPVNAESPTSQPETQPAAQSTTQPAATQPADPVRFFGLADRGEKIGYVVDKSGSMFVTMDYAKAELIRSVKALEAGKRFHVVFFSDRETELTIDGKSEYRPATQKAKDAAAEWIRQQVARSSTGQTDPRQAIERAFRATGGPPDVVYLLTDGLFPEGAVELIDRLNAGRRMRVHTIGFVDREGEKQLMEIARKNGGKYRFVSTEELAREW